MIAKIHKLETNSKTKNITDLYRGINDFKKVYQIGTNKVRDEKGDWVGDCYSTWLGRGTISTNY